MKKNNILSLLLFVSVRKKNCKGVLVAIFGYSAVLAQNLQISGGNNYSAAVCDNQIVYVWGSNGNGQLGIDASDNPIGVPYRPTPAAVTRGNVSNTIGGLTYGNLPAIRQIDAGSGGHLLGLSCTGQVWAWGYNSSGQLGRNTTTDSPIPQRVLRGQQPANVNANDPNGIFLNGIVYVSGGNNTSYAIEGGTGRVLAWGENDFGQLGDGTTTDKYTPVYVLTEGGDPLANIVQIEGGDETAYALDANGFVWSWGRNNGNQLGRPGASPQTRAARVVRAMPGCNGYGCPLDGYLRNIVQLSGGDTHALALDADGFVWSFGGDWGEGQLGRGEGAVYQDYAARVIRPGRTTYCNGCPDSEFLGGTPEGKARYVAAGQASSAVVLANGNVVTFGARGLFNSGATVIQSGTINCPGTGEMIASGTLGDGNVPGCNSGTCNGRANNRYSRTPVFVTVSGGARLSNIISVSDGDAWYYAITSAGQAFVWGWNRRGELGLGDYADRCFAESFALPTGCAFSHPCPGKPTLGADITTCPVFTQTLESQVPKTFPTYVHTWRYSASGAPGTFNVIGGNTENITVNQIGYYIVEVSDNRASVPFLCEPCPVLRDTIRIQEVPNPYTVAACQDNANSLAQFSVTAPTSAKIKWYTELTGGTALNPTDSNTTIVVPFIQTNTSYAPSCPRALFAEDVSSVIGTLLPATNVTQLETALNVGGESCNQGNWGEGWIDATSTRGAMMLVVNRTINITQASVIKGDNNNGTFGIVIHNNNPTGGPYCNSCTPASNKHGLGPIVYTSPAVSSSAAAGTILQIPMNYTLNPGIYWIRGYGSGGQIRTFNCNKAFTNGSDVRWTHQFVDNTGQNILRGVNHIWDGSYQRIGSAFNIRFTAGTGYTCGRVRVCVTSTCTLPVEFASIAVRQVNGKAELEWATAMEKDAYLFEVQRSSDGINFVGVSTVMPVGNSSGMQSYTASVSLRGLSGIQYFRVVEKNKEGMVSSISETRAIYVEGKRDVKIVPNPSSGVFQLMWSDSNAGDAANYIISNTVGEVVKKGVIRSGEVQLIDMAALSKGVYYVAVMDQETTYVEKVVIQ